MAILPWFKRWPKRLAFECQALESAGIRYEVDEKAHLAGIIKMSLYPMYNGETVHLEATFPDLYPYFRFEIRAPELDLERHQHVFGKGLCLIGRRTDLWNTTDTLATFVQERVPLVMEVAGQQSDPQAVAGLEEPYAEPIADTYAHAFSDASIILFDGSWSIDKGIERGDLVIGIEAGAVPLIRGWVLQVRDERRQVLNELGHDIQNRYPQKMVIPWIRMATPPRTYEPVEFWNTVAQADPRVEATQWKTAKDAHLLRGLAVVCEDEVAYQEKGDGFLFAFSILPPQQFGSTRRYLLIRPGHGGRADLIARAPELAPLADKSIAVFGLGCVGSPSVLEFARGNVGELRLLDCDVVEPGTIVRWVFGISAAGWSKSKALHDHIRANYPYTRVTGERHRIGGIREDSGDDSDYEVVARMTDGVSLIYDTSQELGVQHFLSDVAREIGVPYIRAGGTQGGWGGIVVRIRPGTTEGCFHCLEQSLLDHTIPLPPFDPNGEVQPAGCSDPTFTGANFDLQTVALAGVRMAVGTLCGPEQGYPDVDWDVAIISFRDSHGQPIPLQLNTYRLERNPECPRCATT